MLTQPLLPESFPLLQASLAAVRPSETERTREIRVWERGRLLPNGEGPSFLLRILLKDTRDFHIFLPFAGVSRLTRIFPLSLSEALETKIERKGKCNLTQQKMA